jgi:bifunctional enzyme CysN/CysC
VILQLHQPLAFELPDIAPELGRYVIVDDFQIAGGGIIQAGLPDGQAHLRSQALERNRNWIPGNLTAQDRAARYHQKPGLVIITGLRGAGRKHLARQLEEYLFANGRMVYYVGIGSVIHGLNQDVVQPTHSASAEHIRRLAEVAHLMLDAGMILVLTAVEFTAENLEMLNAALTEETILTIWMGNEITTDIPFDLQVLADEAPEAALARVLVLLHEQGLIST